MTTAMPARFVMIAALAVPLALGACAPTDTTTDTLAGGALGAAGGAAIGALAGNAALGAAIGGGVGLVGGYFNNQYEIKKRQ